MQPTTDQELEALPFEEPDWGALFADARDPNDPYNTVDVQFLAESFRDTHGATNEAETERFDAR